MKADEIRKRANLANERSAFARYEQQDWLAEIAAQLAELNQHLRDLRPELNQPEECRQQKCTYYKHYLAYGPADLTHEGFHAAEQNGTEHFKDCSRTRNGDPCPVCDGYERRLRA